MHLNLKRIFHDHQSLKRNECFDHCQIIQICLSKQVWIYIHLPGVVQMGFWSIQDIHRLIWMGYVISADSYGLGLGCLISNTVPTLVWGSVRYIKPWKRNKLATTEISTSGLKKRGKEPFRPTNDIPPLSLSFRLFSIQVFEYWLFGHMSMRCQCA